MKGFRRAAAAPRPAGRVTKPRRVRPNHFRRSAAEGGAAPASRLRQAGNLLLGAAGFVLLNLLLILGHDLLVQWPALRGEDIQVEGAQRLSPERVLEQAGIARGDNLLKVNLGLARKRLLAHPWIAEAEIRREIPSRIRVRIREEVCLAVADLGTRFLVNAEGGVFKELEPDDLVDAPVITGLEVTDLGVDPGAASPLGQAALDLLRLAAGPAAALPLARIDRVHADREMGLVVHLRGEPPHGRGAVVRLGLGGLREKLQRGERVLARWEALGGRRDFRVMDLQNPERVIVTPPAEGSGNEQGKEV